MLSARGLTSNLYSSKKYDDKMKAISRTSDWGSSFSEKGGCMQTPESRLQGCDLYNELVVYGSSSSSMTRKIVTTNLFCLGQNKYFNGLVTAT
ncbi:putative uncharacterized protein encoded by LINC00474 [Trachypithecus francoisi]|uniref:putative uncharacterized protein encoded by LINC00474 n=1 Tax=Trachypithecus francoisi TaxID=54180 RepID=UPI00141B34B1|nr:putative uncharacterized protein encoded by LINC00474 [Trachypithecus francoisi]